MTTSVDLNNISAKIQDALYDTLKDMSLEELQLLDWFTWETDFFLEKKHEQAA